MREREAPNTFSLATPNTQQARTRIAPRATSAMLSHSSRPCWVRSRAMWTSTLFALLVSWCASLRYARMFSRPLRHSENCEKIGPRLRESRRLTSRLERWKNRITKYSKKADGHNHCGGVDRGRAHENQRANQPE